LRYEIAFETKGVEAQRTGRAASFERTDNTTVTDVVVLIIVHADRTFGGSHPPLEIRHRPTSKQAQWPADPASVGRHVPAAHERRITFQATATGSCVPGVLDE